MSNYIQLVLPKHRCKRMTITQTTTGGESRRFDVCSKCYKVMRKKRRPNTNPPLKGEAHHSYKKLVRL